MTLLVSFTASADVIKLTDLVQKFVKQADGFFYMPTSEAGKVTVVDQPDSMLNGPAMSATDEVMLTIQGNVARVSYQGTAMAYEGTLTADSNDTYQRYEMSPADKENIAGFFKAAWGAPDVQVEGEGFIELTGADRAELTLHVPDVTITTK